MIVLPRCDLLDPRPLDEAEGRPIAGSVHIPCDELPQRVHELPPRDQMLRIADVGPAARRAAEWLAATGRANRLDAAFAYAPAGARQTQRRLWCANAWLEELAPRLIPAHALDLACGVGREAVYLKALGWRVTAVDRLPDALQRGRDLEARYAPGLPQIAWLQADLEKSPPADMGRFRLITIFRFLHRPLLARLAEWLEPGGCVLIETFTRCHQQRHGRPARAEHVLAPGELRQLVPALTVEHYSEGWRGQAHMARLWAVAR